MNHRIVALAIAVLLAAPIQVESVLLYPNPEVKPVKKMKVRVTAYWVGQDEWTNKLQSSTGQRLISGRSCAVDPRVIPYGSTVVIGNREFKAIDTGTAVVTRKASRGTLPVVDLFFKTERQAMAALDNLPSHPWAEIR